jgi:hypothetical protein
MGKGRGMDIFGPNGKVGHSLYIIVFMITVSTESIA